MLQRYILSPSSQSKSKPNEKSAEAGGNLIPAEEDGGDILFENVGLPPNYTLCSPWSVGYTQLMAHITNFFLIGM